MAQKQKPFHRITMVRSRLDAYADLGDRIFESDADRNELLLEAHYAITQLMAFRNIINGMVNFDEEPKDAALPYIEK